jgi:hypothetical protein
MEESASPTSPSPTLLRCVDREEASYPVTQGGSRRYIGRAVCSVASEIGLIMRYMLDEPCGAAVELFLFTNVVNTAEFMKLVLSGELDVGALDAEMVRF